MKTTLTLLKRAALLLPLLTLNPQLSTWAQGTAFTYQGRLYDGTNPANGSYDLKFTIWTAASGGVVAGAPMTNSATGVSNGLFGVTLDFGNSPFSTGAPRWVEIAARTNGAGSFTNLSPRQKFTATPYAITAGNFTGTLGNAQLTSDSITVNAGAGLSGGGTVALGGTTTLNNAGVLSVTGNADITATTVNGAVTLGDTATSADAANTIVKRNASGDFTTASINLDKNLNLPATTASAGIIYSDGFTLLHSYGANNFFAGRGAGNLTMSGAVNTGIGFGVLANNTSGPANTGIGFRALQSNTSGSGNAALGLNALLGNTTGDHNTASGLDSLAGNTQGIENTASGAYALQNNTNGSYNTAIGTRALDQNRNGGYNTASGAYALQQNTVGIGNTASGYYALQRNTTGGNNTAQGQAALSFNTSGANNTAIGSASLPNLSSGSGNIAIGVNAGSAITSGSDNIDIGNAGFGNESGVIRIGTLGTHTKAVMNGIFGVTVAGGSGVMVNANGLLGTVTSSRRFKHNIQSMDDASDVLLALHPVTFQYKTELDPDGTPQFGLVAEEVEKVNPALVVRDDKNRVYSVRYEAVNAMLLNEFLKQHRRVEEQSREIEALKEKAGKFGVLEKRLSELEHLMRSLQETK